VDRTALEHDEIRLDLPAQPEFARVARVAGGGLAARLGFSYDEVEEVRLAIGEAWAIVLGSEQEDGRVEVRFGVGLESMSVELIASVPGPRERPDVSPAADPVDVLRRITDELDLDAGRRRLRFEKTQR
jgi:serine/threonine-protein kinase RsbW